MAPINETQRRFEKLCAHGGSKGSPDKSEVLSLLCASGKALNESAYKIAKAQFDAHPDANPWFICFAIGVAWGHLARLETEFTTHVIGALTELNDDDIKGACSFHLERGEEPVRQSLVGAYSLFQKVTLPPELPTTLDRLYRAEERWLSPIAGPNRPRYIGAWNATAMFMAALFAQPSLAKTQRTAKPILPPGGPIPAGLRMLHAAKVLSRPPAGSMLDDEAFESGALYENNALLVELVEQRPDWCVLDVHSGVYMLGTRDPKSDTWI